MKPVMSCPQGNERGRVKVETCDDYRKRFIELRLSVVPEAFGAPTRNDGCCNGHKPSFWTIRSRISRSRRKFSISYY